MLKKLAAAFAIAACSAVAHGADLPTYPFIHVNGAASLHVMPDTGEIDFKFASQVPDLEAAWNLVSKRLAASRALFARHGVASDAPRYTPVTTPGDPLLIGVQKLVQGVDVIYRIGK